MITLGTFNLVQFKALIDATIKQSISEIDPYQFAVFYNDLGNLALWTNSGYYPGSKNDPRDEQVRMVGSADFLIMTRMPCDEFEPVVFHIKSVFDLLRKQKTAATSVQISYQRGRLHVDFLNDGGENLGGRWLQAPDCELPPLFNEAREQFHFMVLDDNEIERFATVKMSNSFISSLNIMHQHLRSSKCIEALKKRIMITCQNNRGYMFHKHWVACSSDGETGCIHTNVFEDRNIDLDPGDTAIYIDAHMVRFITNTFQYVEDWSVVHRKDHYASSHLLGVGEWIVFARGNSIRVSGDTSIILEHMSTRSSGGIRKGRVINVDGNTFLGNLKRYKEESFGNAICSDAFTITTHMMSQGDVETLTNESQKFTMINNYYTEHLVFNNGSIIISEATHVPLENRSQHVICEVSDELNNFMGHGVGIYSNRVKIAGLVDRFLNMLKPVKFSKYSRMTMMICDSLSPCLINVSTNPDLVFMYPPARI